MWMRRDLGLLFVALVALVLVGLPGRALAAAHTPPRSTRLVSQLPPGMGDPGVCGSQRHGCHVRITPDGKHVFFMLNDGPLFDWSAGVTTPVSVGPLGIGTLGGGCYPYGGECGWDPAPDGRSVFFVTRTQLVPEDLHTGLDLYLRREGRTTLVSSLGPLGGSGTQRLTFDGLSADRSRAYYNYWSFDRDDPWLYEWTDGHGASRFPSEALPAEHVQILKRLSANGEHVLFETNSSLVPQDTDSCQRVGDSAAHGCSDVYERTSDGRIRVLTIGPVGGGGSFDAHVIRLSDDGRDLIFSTGERLMPEDTDSCPNPDRYTDSGCSDVYERTPNGTVKLLTTGPAGGSGGYDAEFLRRAPDGSILFHTREPLVPEDTDECRYARQPPRGCDDVYERTADGRTILISSGDGPYDASFAGAAADFSWVLFRTLDTLLDDDVNDLSDIYERIGNQLRLIATGPDGGIIDESVIVSKDGTKFFWETYKALLPEDDDYPPNWPYSAHDVYEFADGKLSLVSTGPTDTNEALDARFDHISDDGRYVYFYTRARLTADDTNGVDDLYVRDTVDDVTRLILNEDTGGAYGQVLARSRNGRFALFRTDESLVPEDTDHCRDELPFTGCPDLYIHDRRTGQNTLVSTGPADDQRECGYDGPACPSFVGASPDLSRIYFQTDLPLTADDSDGTLKDVYLSTVLPAGCKDRGSGKGPAKCR
jgi:hypothetical protein